MEILLGPSFKSNGLDLLRPSNLAWLTTGHKQNSREATDPFGGNNATWQPTTLPQAHLSRHLKPTIHLPATPRSPSQSSPFPSESRSLCISLSLINNEVSASRSFFIHTEESPKTSTEVRSGGSRRIELQNPGEAPAAVSAAPEP